MLLQPMMMHLEMEKTGRDPRRKIEWRKIIRRRAR